MKAQFISTLLCSPWQISQDRGRAIIGSMLSRLRGERPEEDVFGDPLPKMQIVGDVAIIPIVGTMMMNVPDWVKKYGFGLTDANDVELELERAVNDPNVAMIVQDFDSPGGLSVAGNKLFDLFEAANRKKPVFAWSGDGAMMCSAAYNAAAPARAILCGKYATLGSIGSYCVYADQTEFWKMMGISFEVFRSGEFKGMGIDGLDDEQRAFIQAGVDESGARIRKNVSKYQTEIAKEDLRGQWYAGQEAFARNFAGGNAKDLAAAIKLFRKML